MTDKMGEMILEQLFKMQEKMVTKDDLKNFATKDDLKNFATKDDLKNFATKDDLKELEIRLDKKMDDKLDKQTKEIAEELKSIYSLTERKRIKMSIEFDRKIGQLRKEFINANKK